MPLTPRRSPVLALAALLAACTPRPHTDPAKVAEAFHAVLFAAPVVGAPTPDDMERLRPFLSDTLAQLLERAGRIRDSETRAAPGEKPRFTDGDLFTSLVEGPTSFAIIGVAQGSPGKVVVRYDRDEGNGKHTVWTDTTVLVPRDTTWVVDDIRYGGDWPFAQKGSLREALGL